MIDLSRFLDNPFDDRDISLAELLSFSTDHLQRLIANNPGALYNTRITATTTALNVVSQCVTDDTLKLGLRKGRVLAKRAFRTALPQNIEDIYFVVGAKFRSGTPEMLDIFPEGRTIFTQITDDLLENKLTTLHTALSAKVAALGSDVVDNAAGLLSTWITLHAASESATGAKTATQEGKAAARSGLQLQLFLNLLEIAKNNARQSEKLPLYMQQHFLEDPASPEEPEDPPTPPVPPAP